MRLGAPARSEGQVARSAPLAGRVDLLSSYDPVEGFFFERSRVGVVGSGAAMRIVVPAGRRQVARAAGLAAEALARIRIEGEVGPAVVGALPFDHRRPATLVVPAMSIRALPDGSVWRVVVGSAEKVAVRPPARRVLRTIGRDLRIRPDPGPGRFVSLVRDARRRIRSGKLRKVVLARSLLVGSDLAFDPTTVLRWLRDRDPSCYVFGVSGLVGASPERLVARSGREIIATPLAGTAPRGSDARTDAESARRLLASAKDRSEHQMVVEAVRSSLEGVCDRLWVQPEPSPASTSAVWHLSTEIRGRLRLPAPSALALAARLHPTPAVCGTPTEAALATIREMEAIDRGRYAGLVGWVDAEGDGEWTVTLRCAEVRGGTARLFAGAGIVADSDPEAELAETDAKFRVLLEALRHA